MKAQFKFGELSHVFKIFPTIQIEWSRYKYKGFAIVLVWLLYGVGIRFYKKDNHDF